MIKDQEKDIDEIGGITRVVRYEAQNFGAETDLQSKMIAGVTKSVVKTTGKLAKANERLESMVNKRSTMFYYAIIAIEILAIFIVLAI